MAKVQHKVIRLLHPRLKRYILYVQYLIVLKIAPLLIEFLLLHKRLDLPGIGSFVLDASNSQETGNPKTGSSFTIEGASFESNTAIRESTELVNFIAESTGKQKALAAADLHSHLETVRQFLNIGKPYHFEGIGSLSKLQSGKFHFSPGAEQVEKAAGRSKRDTVAEAEAEENSGGFKSIFYARKVKTDSRKTLFILLLIIGIGLAIWGGYTVYKRTTARNEKASAGMPEGNSTGNDKIQNALPDSAGLQNDSLIKNVAAMPPENIPAPGQYRFVVEIADKTRGLKRFNLLKGFGLPVKMETRDSLVYKIFFLLPATASDTTRLRDSLQRLYSPAGIKAFVEK